jgi:hypothetical protein
MQFLGKFISKGLKMEHFIFLYEMARNIGKPFSLIENRPGWSKKSYEQTKLLDRIHDISNGVTVHKKEYGERKDFIVNDHNRKMTLYTSTIITNKPTKFLKNGSIEQVSVDREKDSSVLPKNFATNFIYDHWANQTLPLKSNEMQYTTGHQMWHRLVHRALNDKKHVYMVDNNAIHKVDYGNVNEMLHGSFGKDSEYENKHLILSHQPLTN